MRRLGERGRAHRVDVFRVAVGVEPKARRQRRDEPRLARVRRDGVHKRGLRRNEAQRRGLFVCAGAVLKGEEAAVRLIAVERSLERRSAHRGFTAIALRAGEIQRHAAVLDRKQKPLRIRQLRRVHIEPRRRQRRVERRRIAERGTLLRKRGQQLALRDGAAALRAVERLGQIAAKLFKRIVQRSEIILRAHAPRRVLHRDGDGLRRAVDLIGDDVTGVGQLRLRQAEQRRDGPQNGRKPRRGRDRPRGQGQKRQDHDGQSQDDNQDVFENFEDLSGHCGSLPFVSCLPKGPLYEEGGAAAAHGAGDQWSPLRSPPELRSNS